MMPVPSHLLGLVHPKSSVIDETPLDATVVCPCGGNQFELLYPGQTHIYRGEQIPCTTEINDTFYFLIKVRCVTCGREHLLFDKDFHGWNGFVCHDPATNVLPRPPLKSWTCLKCGKTKHEACVKIETQGREDFITELDGNMDESRWPDGFSWFYMSIQCIDCGKETSEWVSYETM